MKKPETFRRPSTIHNEIYIKMKTIADPIFFRRYLEEYPFSSKKLFSGSLSS